MDIEERVAELERRLDTLERREEKRRTPVAEAPGLPAPTPSGELWALHELQRRLAEREDAENGGVVFAGAVRTPAGRRYEWQYGELTETVLDGDWADASESFAALGQPVRLRLLREILGGRCTAAELAELDGVGTSGQIYHHLRQLTGTGWLHSAARGRYQVPAERVVPLLVMVTASVG